MTTRPRRVPSEFTDVTVTTVVQGECLISAESKAVFATLLGSCISACIRDVVTGVGGMNHFLLAAPSGSAVERYGASARYGAFAMEQLINGVLSRGSGDKRNLEIKVFGGGITTAALSDIGAKNIEFVHEFLENEGYTPASSDMGGTYARRVMFQPTSGRVFVKRLDSVMGASIGDEELVIARRPVPVLATTPDIELF